MVKCVAIPFLFALALGANVAQPKSQPSRLQLNQRSNTNSEHEWGLLGLAVAAAASSTADDRHNQKLRQERDAMWNVKEHSLLSTKLDAPPPVPADKKPAIDMWYINLEDMEGRAACMTEQLRRQNFTARKYVGSRKVTGDCTKKGVDRVITRTHASRKGDDDELERHVLSNWCNHKHIFDYLSSGKPGVGDSEYVVIFEDDAVLTPNFRDVLEDFIVNFKGRAWDFVQIDPFGPLKPKPLAWHRERPVYKAASFEPYREHMWGMQALLARRKELPKLSQWMDEHAALPIDWIQKGVPSFISYSGGIALQSEMNRVTDPRLDMEAYTGGVKVKTPDFCDKSVSRSSIALLQAD